MKNSKKIVLIISIILVSIILTITSITLKYKSEKNNINKNELIYNNPNKFEKSMDEVDYKSYYYYSDNINCSYVITMYENYKKYKDGNNYLEDNITFTLNDKVGEVEEKSIGNYKWYLLKIDKGSETEYNYATIYNNNTYELTYKIHDYMKGDYSSEADNYCYNALDELLSSLSFKK